MSFPIKNGDFHSYVSLPEGTGCCSFADGRERFLNIQQALAEYEYDSRRGIDGCTSNLEGNDLWLQW